MRWRLPFLAVCALMALALYTRANSEEPEAVERYALGGYAFDHYDITYTCGNDTLRDAVRAWAAVSGLRDGGCSDTPDIKLIVVDPWDDLPSVLGKAGYYGAAGIIWQSVIFLRVDTQHHLGVMVHELGHGIGIGHSADITSAMYPYCCNPIGPSDIAAVQALYGPEPQPPRYVIYAPMVAN